MRIAMVSEHANPLTALGEVDAGGQNLHVAELSSALVAGGHEVTVYTRRDSDEVPTATTAPGGYNVVHVPAGPPAAIPKDDLLPYMGDFAQFLRREWRVDPPDVVHAHFWMSGLAAIRATQSTGVPVVHTFHALGSVKRRHQGNADTSPPGRHTMERQIGLRANRIVATCSDEVFELARMDVPRSSISVVPCGVNLEEFTPPPRRERRSRRQLVAVGRLVPRKGFEVAIRAMRELPDTELTIAGGPPSGRIADDPEALRLNQLATDLGVAERVTLAGQVPRSGMPPLLRSADAVLCTPWYEPFGIVPLEAMACGVPVIASAVGGLVDTVVDGVTGALVPPQDPTAVAEAVHRVTDDPSTRDSCGTAGRERVRSRYSWQRIAADTQRAYHAARTDASARQWTAEPATPTELSREAMP